ncbi:malate dehydrogenase, mitochondrial-like [Onthophagus taurus]|uniref:malate dehydrogenase, mitochondrial-like n=1 Tax=Onthophagus taurus TaxID=166361 RepID=UPI000C201112|nr:uncharacterized protein LOC111413175 [Onthophagus taurus]
MFSKLSVFKLPNVVAKIFKRSLNTGGYCEWSIEEPQRPMTVSIIGGHTGEGVLATFLLKQTKLVDEIRLYSGLISPCGQGYDMSHIDTSPQIKAYTGQKFLRDVITDAHIVLICGGHPKKPCTTTEELFESNADYVRNIAMYVGEFNPKAIVCISTPPVGACVPLVAEVLKKNAAYDPRKVIGIMTLGSIRATSITAKYTNNNPSDVIVPVIGALSRDTLIPVFSQIRPEIHIDEKLLQLLRDKIASAEDEALDLKYIESTGSCFLSSAFATARFTASVIKGLKGDANVVECGFVRQLGHIQEFLPYMGSIVKLGKDGVEQYYMPTITDDECKQLQKAYPLIKSQIEMGETFVLGAQRKARINLKSPLYCQMIRKKPITMIGDVKIDLNELDIDKNERCIEIIR